MDEMPPARPALPSPPGPPVFDVPSSETTLRNLANRRRVIS